MVLELLGPRLGRLTLATVTDLDASVEHARAQARARAELERQAHLVQLRLSSGQHAPDDGQRVPALVLATGRPAEVLPRLAAEGGYDLLVSAAAAPGRPRSCWAAPRLLQKAMSLLRRGGTEHLRLSQLNFVGAGPAMMRKLASDHQVASPQELAREMGVRLIPCQMTMDLLSRTREDMIDRLEEPAGAATALAEAQNAITLFI